MKFDALTLTANDAYLPKIAKGSIPSFATTSARACSFSRVLSQDAILERPKKTGANLAAGKRSEAKPGLATSCGYPDSWIICAPGARDAGDARDARDAGDARDARDAAYGTPHRDAGDAGDAGT